MIAKHNYHKIILAFTGVFTLITGVLVFLHPAAIFPDPSWGFQVMRGMQMGGAFNMLPAVDMADIAKNNPTFLSWWSPGQYLTPYLFISLFKLNIGQANGIVVILCSLTGLLGFYACFKKIGFSAGVAAVSIAFIACQQGYMVPFVFYNGGEVLLFAFAGWFLYGCTSFTKAGWLEMAFIFASGVIGFFCKSSFIWIYFSGSLYLWVRLSSGKSIAKWLLNGLSVGVPAVLALTVIYATYLSKGENPASDAGPLKLAWETFSFPMASPLLAGFSVDDLANGLITHAGPPFFNPFWTIVVLIVLATISAALVIYMRRAIPHQNYKLLLIIFYSISILFFGITFLRQSNISYESRHLRIIGLIITPGVIYLIAQLSKPYRIVFGLIWLFIAYVNFQFLRVGYQRNTYQAVHGSTGIGQLFIDEPTLKAINQLDKATHNAVFVFTSPDLGLEIKNNRIITFDPLDDNLAAEEDLFTYAGHGGPVYLILPKSYARAKAALYMKCLPGYSNFTITYPGKNYLIYTAK